LQDFPKNLGFILILLTKGFITRFQSRFRIFLLFV